MVSLLKTLLYEMHSYSTPMSPYVEEILLYISKFFLGEEYELGSDFLIRKRGIKQNNLKEDLIGISFFRRDYELDPKFKSDVTDKSWFTEQKNLTFMDKSNYWN